jgi:hypothetical protein
MSIEGWRARLAVMEPEFCAVVFGDPNPDGWIEGDPGIGLESDEVEDDAIRICCSCRKEFEDQGLGLDPICDDCNEGEY